MTNLPSPSRPSPNPKTTWLWLVIILAVFISLAVSHVVLQPLPNQWDDSEYANATFKWLQFIEDRGDLLRGTFWGAVYALPHHLPPMVFFTSLLGGLISPTVLAMRLAHVLWFAVLLATAYGTGHLLKGMAGAAASAAAIGTLPLIFFWAKTVMGEPALFAATGLLLWALIAWGERLNWWRGLVIGAIIGFGLLTKQHFLVAAVGPLGIWGLWLLIQFIREPGSRRATLISGVLAVIAAIAVAAPWYAISWKDMLAYASQPAFTLHTLGPTTNWYTISTYLGIVTGEMGWPAMLLLLLGVVWVCVEIGRAIRKRQFDWRAVSLSMLFASGLVGFLVALNLRNINSRFVVPALIGWGMLAGLAWIELWQARGRLVRGGLVILTGVHLIFFWTVSFGPALPTWLTFLPQDGDLRPTDMTLTWKTFDTVNAATKPEDKITLWVVGNYHSFNMPTFVNIVTERHNAWQVKELYHWTDTASDVATIITNPQPGDWIAIYRQPRQFVTADENLVSRLDDALLDWMKTHPDDFELVTQADNPAARDQVWIFSKK
jgi:4-amino-4-deoxy-L-arabinose transferase-like glycosyltransferase